jgi:hypothetical protein
VFCKIEIKEIQRIDGSENYFNRTPYKNWVVQSLVSLMRDKDNKLGKYLDS